MNMQEKYISVEQALSFVKSNDMIVTGWARRRPGCSWVSCTPSPAGCAT